MTDDGNNDPLDPWRRQRSQFYKELQEHEAFCRYNDTTAIAQGVNNEYAHLGIKSLTMINSGALLLLPAVTEAFELSLNSNIYYSA